METVVKIKWDEPSDKNWLCPDNIKTALSAYCTNTKFEVSEVDSNLLDAQVSQAVSQAMPEPNSQVCANCKWLADRDGENNYFCNCYESETCDILIILKDTFGCNKFERKLL